MSEFCLILRFGGHFIFWGPFCFSKKIQNLVRLSIQTSMRNLDSIAQEMSKLCSILWFGGHIVFQNFVKICSDCPYELPCKIWSLLLKNEQVMALGTKEDKHLSIIYIQVIIQSKLHFSYSRRKNPNKKNFRTSYFILHTCFYVIHIIELRPLCIFLK